MNFGFSQIKAFSERVRTKCNAYIGLKNRPLQIGLTMKYWNEASMLGLWLSVVNQLDIDNLYLFNDGSTDKSGEIVEYWRKNLARMLEVFNVDIRERHDEYFNKSESEGKIINEQIKFAKNDGCDWLIKLDADEIVSNKFNNLIKLIRSGEKKQCSFFYLPTANMVEKYEYVNSHVINHKYYPDYHARILNLNKNEFYHEENHELDTTLKMKRKAKPDIFELEYAIIHLHFLFPNRRSKRFVKKEEDDGAKHDYYY